MKMLAYGMNTNKNSMALRAPGAKFLGKAKLHKHKLVFKYFADIEASENDMWGVLWEIGPDELKAMDYTEGYPTFYDRKEVDVDFDGSKEKAWVYYMVDKEDYKHPNQFYLNMLMEGYEQAGIGMGQLHLAQAECTLMAGTA